MRPGISTTLSPAERRRLAALVRDRNTAQKHVWRAEIVLLSAEGIGNHEIVSRTGKSYGLRPARYRGLARVTYQVRLTAIAFNLKRANHLPTPQAA